MKKFIIALLFFFASFTTLHAQVMMQYKYTPQSATGYTEPFQFSVWTMPPVSTGPLNRFMPSNYTITITPTGSPATCTYRVFGTLRLITDNPQAPADYAGAQMASDITCTSKITIHVAYKPFNTVIGQLVTLTGGTNPTVTLEILAK